MLKDQSRAYFELPAGKTEAGDKLNDDKFDVESSYETALRETVEETRGCLGRRLLVNASDSKDLIRYGDFDIFLSKTPMFDLEEINPIRIPKGNNKQNHWDPMREIIDYAWVDIATLYEPKSNNMSDMKDKNIEVHYALPSESRIAQTKGWFK
ncbi:MAG: NUDIX hydrolase [Pseudomonadales bacterium]|nr:NUDIX hydrolase [Pseudomonadales bacterium]